MNKINILNYCQLLKNLSIFEGKNIKLIYAGSRISAEKLKISIIKARMLNKRIFNGNRNEFTIVINMNIRFLA